MLHDVAPFAGAWIEISSTTSSDIVSSSSLRSPERGLKSDSLEYEEIMGFVAPFAGAWIEIATGRKCRCDKASLRSPERGLKSVVFPLLYFVIVVAPFAGAWIEIAIA